MYGNFRLIKWYFDCVGEEGSSAIAYRADLRWRKVRLHYAAALGGHTTLKRAPRPVSGEGTLAWQAPALDLAGEWTAEYPPFHRTLLDGVDWYCLAPRARAVLRIGGRTVRGLGYAERLVLTVPPWRLPLRELYWGRFLSDSDGLVWVRWRGDQQGDVVLRRGAPAGAELMDRLELERGTVLREGALLNTALAHVPGASLFPNHILEATETKWLSRGALDGVPGWAIHEVVRWPS